MRAAVGAGRGPAGPPAPHRERRAGGRRRNRRGADRAARAWRRCVALAPPDLPRLDEVTVDASALAFALGISLVASLVFGLAPAWHVSRVDLADGLRQGGKGSALGVRGGWARKAFVVAEIGLGGGAGDGRRAARRAASSSWPGWTWALRASAWPCCGRPCRSAGPEEFARATAVYRGLLDEMRGLPEVASAGAVTALPTRAAIQWQLLDRGRPGPRGADPQRAAGALHRRHARLLRDARRGGGARPRRRRRRSARRAVRGGGQRTTGDATRSRASTRSAAPCAPASTA